MSETNEMNEKNGKHLVLVVDDHRPAAEMLRRLFQTRGYHAEIAEDGFQAVEKAIALQPHLILLDVMMPGMDGFQVMETLRENSATATIPTIFITAKDDASDIEHGLKLGADDYIPKPVRPRELLARASAKIEARELRNALEQRTKDLQALLRFSEELNNHLELDDLMHLILYLVLDLIPGQAAVLYRMNEAGEILDVRATQKQDGMDFELNEDALFSLLSQEMSVVQWSDESHPDLSNFAAGLAISLRYGDNTHGVLAMFGYEPFVTHHARLFEGIGRQVTLAMRNAELYEVKVEYADRLEEMVEERTEELRSAQDLLVRAEKLASVGRLAAGIAHEINNPLMPIRVNLELMQEDIQDGVAIKEKDVEESLRSVKRISRIVERLQQFTRKRGSDTPDMEEVNIADVIEGVITLSRSYVRQGGISIISNLDESATVYGNRDQLEQVFLNIIINAKAAMMNGGELQIDSYLEGDTLVMRFADTGHGIEAEMIDTIFEPFVSTKTDGSGLGLFISYGIIQDHSGTIEVDSEVGKGTVFTLTLPTVQAVHMTQ